jgi:hypothetical protein
MSLDGVEEITVKEVILVQDGAAISMSTYITIDDSRSV